MSKVDRWRYVIEYCDNPFHGNFNYDTEFDDINKAQIFLASAVHHLGAKCKDGNMWIVSIQLQPKYEGRWVIGL